MYCSQCGAELIASAKFCQSCGNAVSIQKEIEKEHALKTLPNQVTEEHHAETPTAGVTNKTIVDYIKPFFGGDLHPWRRFFARVSDTLIIGSFLLSFVYFAMLSFQINVEWLDKLLESPITGSILIYLLWLPFEVFFLVAIGTTPGKWVFGISVLTKDGNTLSYDAAVRRTIQVFIQGECIGIPFLSVFSRFFSYRRLIKTGTTVWDTAAGSVVKHKKWNAGRLLLSVIVVLTSLYLIKLNQDALSQQMRERTISCENQGSTGCSKPEIKQSAVEGEKQVKLKKLEQYAKACDGGDLKGCNNLGLIYANGDGVEKDMNKAIKMYTKACDGGYARGCNNLGYSYVQGDGVVQDKIKAKSLFKKSLELGTASCESGEGFDCSFLAIRYHYGTSGVKKNMVKAHKMYTLGCNAGDMLSCSFVGSMYEDGEGVRQDKHKAAILYTKTCDGGIPSGCKRLGKMYAVRELINKGIEMETKECNDGNGVACFILGDDYESGYMVRVDITKAKYFYAKACNLKEEIGCIKYSYLIEKYK